MSETAAPAPKRKPARKPAAPVEVAPELTDDSSVSPAPAPAATPEPEAPAAVLGTGRDPVSLKACVFKNQRARKVLTVHHVQRRLKELGHPDAYADLDGWYGDLTALSVAQFQDSVGLEATGQMDRETFHRLFAGDPNVRIVG